MNEKQLIEFYKNKISRDLNIYTILDKTENNLILTELFKLSCKYRSDLISMFANTKEIENFDIYKTDNDKNINKEDKKLEKIYYLQENKYILSEENNKKFLHKTKNLLKGNIKELNKKDDLELRKILISTKKENNQFGYINFKKEKFIHYSRYYFSIIDVKINIKNDFLNKNFFYIDKKENIFVANTINSNHIYLKIDLNKDLEYLSKYIGEAKKEFSKSDKSENFKENNELTFTLCEKYKLKYRETLLGDLLFIFDCVLLKQKYKNIMDNLLNFHGNNIKRDTIKKYEKIIKELINDDSFTNIDFI